MYARVIARGRERKYQNERERGRLCVSRYIESDWVYLDAALTRIRALKWSSLIELNFIKRNSMWLRF